MVRLLLFSFFLQSCAAQQAPFSGKIALPEHRDWKPMLYLVRPANLGQVAANFSGTVVDSTVLRLDGRFAFEQMPDAPQPILLQLAIQKKGERFANKLDDEDPTRANYCPFVWQNGQKLEVTAEAERLQASFSLQNPSPENAALLRLRDLRHTSFQKHLAQKSGEAHDENTLLEHEAALLNFQKPLMDFADETPHLLPALVALRWVSPAGDFERVPEFLLRQCERWQREQAGNQWVAQLCQLADREKLPLAVGELLPDFQLPMLAGDTLPLRKLQGRRLTLLDLWASWCAPCRRENREVLVPLWEKHQAAGFQIVGYALDSNHKAWQAAIEKDGANRWPHASHLAGDAAPLLESLRLTTIPANFLLDAEGRVLAKNLHGEALRTFVDSYFK